MSVKSMLVEEFNKEFLELNEYFIYKIFPSLESPVDMNLFNNYDLDKINFILGDNKFKSVDELFEALILLMEDGKNIIAFKRNYSLFCIPVFVYLLKNNPTKREEFYNLCMKIHLSKDKIGLFSSNSLPNVDVPFKSRIADKLEMTLLAPNFSIDLRTVIELLDYIDYEKYINGSNEGEYYDFLKRAERELFSYVSFLASDQLLEEFFENRKGNTRNYKYSSVRFNKDALKLMSYYIDIDVKKCKNKYLEFKQLEDRLRNPICSIDSRKNNMLVAFTYRTYPSNDFYESFNEIDLTMDDLVMFINEVEEKGIVLSVRQLDNLLLSYRNWFVDKNNLVNEFNHLNADLKATFDEYRRTRYAFMPDDFIAYYNSKNPTNNFRAFNFGIDTSLSRDIFEMIINDNRIISYPLLINTRTYKDYIIKKNIKPVDSSLDSENFYRNMEIYNKYYDLLEESLFTSEFTIDYIIRKNVAALDMTNFVDFKNWFDKYSSEKWDYSLRVLKRTERQLYFDFLDELGANSFSERFSILRRYNQYACHDKVDSIMRKRYFYTPLHDYERKFIDINGKNIFDSLEDGYKNGRALLPILDKYGLSVCDVEFIFSSMGGDYEDRGMYFYKKALEEKDEADRIKTEQEMEKVSLNKIKLIKQFIADDDIHSRIDFCQKMGISIEMFLSAKKLIMKDDVLRKLYGEKIASLSYKRYLYEGDDSVIMDIYDSMVNGVVNPDGTVRKFNYLDYRLMTDIPVKKFARTISEKIGSSSLVSSFAYNHRDMALYQEEKLFSEKYIIMIGDNAHEVTPEEKRDALNFISSNNLPHEVKIYNLVVRGLLNGELSNDNEKSRPKVYTKKNN